MTSLHPCTALDWRQPGAAREAAAGRRSGGVCLAFCCLKFYILVVFTPGARAVAGAGMPVGVSWAAAVPEWSRAVNAESTGPGGRAASYIMAVGGLRGEKRCSTTVAPKNNKTALEGSGVSAAVSDASD